MSRWTHIAGVIRIDHVPIGRPQLMEEEVKAIVEPGAPQGSEYGLHLGIVRTQKWEPLGGPMNWGWVSLEGDLRDFDEEDLPKLKDWLTSISTLFDNSFPPIMIRQAVVLIEVEYGRRMILMYEGGRWLEIALEEGGRKEMQD